MPDETKSEPVPSIPTTEGGVDEAQLDPIGQIFWMHYTKRRVWLAGIADTQWISRRSYRINFARLKIESRS
jgi:hypothetical protein